MHGLQLRSLQFVNTGAATGRLVQHLPCNTLSQLELYLHGENSCKSYNSTQLTKVFSDLGRLTSLQHLVLGIREDDDRLNHLAGATLVRLVQLTQLWYSGGLTTAFIAQLPRTLVQLQLPFCVPRCSSDEHSNLQLGRLTALAGLLLGYKAKPRLNLKWQQFVCKTASGFMLGSRDVLPPNAKRYSCAQQHPRST